MISRCLFVFSIAFISSVSSWAQTTTWTGATSNQWSDPTNWTNGLPGATDTAIINSANVDVNINPVIGGLQLTEELGLQGGRMLNINNGLFNNNGTFSFGFGNIATGKLLFDQVDATLTGSGRIEMQGNDVNDLFDTLNGVSVTNSSTHEIRGSGYLHASLINEGLIQSAFGNALPLVLADKDKMNSSTIRANSGAIEIRGITLSNLNGTIESDFAPIRITDGATVIGGQLQGRDVEFGTATAEDVEFGSGLTVTVDDGMLTIRGNEVVNQANFIVGGVGADAGSVMFAESTMVDGQGSFALVGGSPNDNIDTAPGAVLTVGEDQRILGSGYVQAAVINDGRIIGELNHETLVLTDKNKVNQGVMGAYTFGILRVEDVEIDNSNGRFEGYFSAVIELDGATIRGGTFDVQDNSEIRIVGDSNLESVHLQKRFTGDFFSDTLLTVDPGQTVTISGNGITNDGTIRFGSMGANGSGLAFTTMGDLNGRGQIEMEGDDSDDALMVPLGATMNHGSEHTIQGSGYVFGDIVNEGTIEANNPAAGMTLDPDGAANGFTANPSGRFINLGTLRATNGATMTLAGDGTGQFENPGTMEAIDGTIMASGMALPQLTPTEITGGTYRAIRGTVNVAPTDYQPTINNGHVEVAGDGWNDVLGPLVGQVHINDVLVENNGALLLEDGASLTLGGNTSHLHSPGNLHVGTDSVLDIMARMTTFQVTNDTTVAGVEIAGGTLSGGGTIVGGVYMPAGTLLPGGAGAAGLMTIQGDFNMDDPTTTNEDALTVIELGGYARGTEYDSFSASGDFLGQGTLAVALINGFEPAVGDEFVIASYLEDGNRVGNLWDDYQFRRVRYSLEDRSSGITESTILTVLEVRGIDFNGDDVSDCSDVDALVAEIAQGTNSAPFDLNFDGLVDRDDLDIWLTDAGQENGQVYYPGDANLNGSVDGADFIAWNAAKFTATAAWCSGDFNTDGAVDGADFLLWNQYKFGNLPPNLSVVPEPTGIALLLAGMFARLRRRTH